MSFLLIFNLDKRKAMGKVYFILAKKEFAVEKRVDKHIDIYHNLLGNVGS